MKKLNMEDFFDLDDNDDLENAMRKIVNKVNKIITALEQTDLNIISLGGSVLTLDDANNILFRQHRDRIEKLEGNPVAQVEVTDLNEARTTDKVQPTFEKSIKKITTYVRKELSAFVPYNPLIIFLSDFEDFLEKELKKMVDDTV